MATDTRNLPAYVATNADFQSWVAGVIAQVTGAGGLVQTADTGQINSGTVAMPAAINTSQGYAIFRFNDTLQATQPIFLKLEFGSGATVNAPSLWATIGTVTNGAGTLSGVLGTRRQIHTSGTAAVSSIFPSYCTGGGTGGTASYFGLVTIYQGGTNNFGLMLVIDRTRDGAGNATADGCLMYSLASSGGNSVDIISYANNTAYSTTTFSGTFTPSSPNVGPNIVGNNVCVSPIMYQLGKLFFSLAAHISINGSIAAGSTISVNTLNGTHTYMTFQPSSTGPTGNSGEDIALLWE